MKRISFFLSSTVDGIENYLRGNFLSRGKINDIKTGMQIPLRPSEKKRLMMPWNQYCQRNAWVSVVQILTEEPTVLTFRNKSHAESFEWFSKFETTYVHYFSITRTLGDRFERSSSKANATIAKIIILVNYSFATFNVHACNYSFPISSTPIRGK